MENSDILQNCGLFLPGKEVLMRVRLCVHVCVYACGGEGFRDGEAEYYSPKKREKI